MNMEKIEEREKFRIKCAIVPIRSKRFITKKREHRND